MYTAAVTYNLVKIYEKLPWTRCLLQDWLVFNVHVPGYMEYSIRILSHVPEAEDIRVSDWSHL